MIRNMSGRMEKSKLQLADAQLFIILHAQCGRMRRAFVENFRRRRAFDDVGIAHDMIRMRVSADDVLHLQSMLLRSFEFAIGNGQ